jgi:hypothetical protein
MMRYFEHASPGDASTRFTPNLDAFVLKKCESKYLLQKHSFSSSIAPLSTFDPKKVSYYLKTRPLFDLQKSMSAFC